MAGQIIKLSEARIREMPLGSGIWRDTEVKGLMVICHRSCRTYAVQGDVRRNKRLVRSVRVKIDRTDRIGLHEARRRAKALMSQIQGGTDPAARPDETGITLKDALEAHLKDHKLRPATAEFYREHADRYLARLRNRAVADITRQDVRELLDALTERHGRTACASALRTLRALVNTARRIDPTIGANPVDAVRIPVPPRREVEELDIADWWSRTATEMSPSMRRLHRAFLLTGARRSSMLQVKREDVDLAGGVLAFRHMKTGDEPLLFPMGHFLSAMLRDQLDETEPLGSEWLWPSQSASGHVAETKRPGMPSAHALRHSFRTLSIEAGVPFSEASLLVGHRMPSVSASYVHASHLVEHLRKHTQAIEDLILDKAGMSSGQSVVGTNVSAPLAQCRSA